MSIQSNNSQSFIRDPNLQHVYLRATLQQIDHLANEDVVMQAPLSEYANFVVVDTNIILHHLEVLQQFVEDLEKSSIPTVIVVPGIVIHELDRHKKKDGLGFFARRGSSWLLEKVTQRKCVKCQAGHETCKSTGNWKKREYGEIFTERYNDGLILDCCMYFSRMRSTVLCSADNNLCLEGETAGVPSIIPNYYWSSREIARSLYGDIKELELFEGYKESYRNPLSEATAMGDDDMMIDEPDDAQWTPQHPLNLLHEAVVDHFTRLLVELVGRVGGEEVRQETSAEEAATLSQHAPRRRHYSRWTAGECLEYLNGRKNINPRPPGAERFLLKVDKKKTVPYARRGWEWTRRDWEIALSNLEETAEKWGDGSIPETVFYLHPHVDAAFAAAR